MASTYSQMLSQVQYSPPPPPTTFRQREDEKASVLICKASVNLDGVPTRNKVQHRMSCVKIRKKAWLATAVGVQPHTRM